MDFSEMKKLFLEQPNYGRYKAEIDNFERYLKNEVGGNINPIYLQGIRTSDIIESISYIIENYRYSSKSIAAKYMTAIAQFFRYATIKCWFLNADFLSEINAPDEDTQRSYYRRVSTFIKKNRKLAVASSKEVLSPTEATLTLDYINNCISNDGLSNISVDKYAALLAIKLMLFTGVKYQVLYGLKTKDVIFDTNQIRIKGFLVRMPLKFTEQMRGYLQLRSNISTNDSLFVQSDGSAWTEITQTSKIGEILQLILFRKDTLGVTKYGIQQLLSVGTSIPIIEEITGAKKDVIRGCGAGFTLSEKDQSNIYINRQISQTDIYYRC